MYYFFYSIGFHSKPFNWICVCRLKATESCAQFIVGTDFVITPPHHLPFVRAQPALYFTFNNVERQSGYTCSAGVDRLLIVALSDANDCYINGDQVI